MKIKSVFTPIVILLYFISTQAFGQLVIDGNDITENKDIEYIQFSFYFEKKGFKPVYSIDYGYMWSDHPDGEKPQQITIEGEVITSSMTPMFVMNKLYKAGWEYLGDNVFMPAPLLDHSQTYTLRRKQDIRK
jgi:hypothetical protein